MLLKCLRSCTQSVKDKSFTTAYLEFQWCTLCLDTWQSEQHHKLVLALYASSFGRSADDHCPDAEIQYTVTHS